MSKRRGGISLYARRFRSLIIQLEKKGISQTEIARRMGVSQGYISKWRNPDGGGRQDIGSVTIERVIKGLRIRGEYFTDSYPEDEERPIELYSFDAERKDRQIDTLTKQNVELFEQNKKLGRLLEDVQRRLDSLEGRQQPQSSRRSNS